MLNSGSSLGLAASAFALDAVGMSVAFPRQLGPVPDQETGIAGKLVRGLGNHLDDELVGDDFAARYQPFIEGVGLVQLGDDTAGIRGVRGLQILHGTVLGFLDVGTDFVIVGCHVGASFFYRLSDALFGRDCNVRGCAVVPQNVCQRYSALIECLAKPPPQINKYFKT